MCLICLWCCKFAAFDAVAYSSVLEDFRVVDDAIDHGSCDGDVSEALSPLGKVRLDVTMMDPCSYRRETS